MKSGLSNRVKLLLVMGGIILLNVLSVDYFTRIDMTEGKRFSLSEVSRETADSLQYPMQVTVYMEGNFPPNVRAFQDALRTTLIELDQYSGRNLEYEFIAPDNATEQELTRRGFYPLDVLVKVSSTESKKQRLWPLLKLKYGERELYVDLLKGSTVMTSQGPQNSFLKAEADLEYKLISGMRKLVNKRIGRVLILQGHGEKQTREIPELISAIESSGYQIFTFDMSKPDTRFIPPADVLIIIQPEQEFPERDKYEIDQYLLRGGSILWIMDNEIVDMNIFENRSTYSQLRSLNLDDMFFQYGYKINYDLVQDLSCARIELFQEEGSKGSITSENWVFYPETYEFPQHPISRNVDLTMARYAASIDTLPTQGLKRSVFFQSSPQSRSAKQQQFINVVAYTQDPPVPQAFSEGPKIMGLLSEGIYTSLFRGRDVPLDSLSPQLPQAPFLEQGNPLNPGKIVVISDGDFVSPKLFRGQIQTQGRINPMPHDNKIMVMNAIDYLAGDIALSNIRSKDVVARVLDGGKISTQGTLIQWLNIGLPLLLLLLFGVIRFYFRKQKHAKLAID